MAPSAESTRLKVFNLAEEGIRTGFAVANPSETESSQVTYRGVGVDGNEFVSGGFMLEPGRHLAFFFMRRRPWRASTGRSILRPALQ